MELREAFSAAPVHELGFVRSERKSGEVFIHSLWASGEDVSPSAALSTSGYGSRSIISSIFTPYARRSATISSGRKKKKLT